MDILVNEPILPTYTVYGFWVNLNIIYNIKKLNVLSFRDKWKIRIKELDFGIGVFNNLAQHDEFAFCSSKITPL